MKIAILGLSITSSWGHNHATRYRALVRALVEAGDDVTFMERDDLYYAAHRDLPEPQWGLTHMYRDLPALRADISTIRAADLVIVGSEVPDGVRVVTWVLRHARGCVAFYDMDTPLTIGQLHRHEHDYISAELTPRFDLYLSSTGGPALDVLREEFGVTRPEPFYGFVDHRSYAPVAVQRQWTLGFLGSYVPGRQPDLQEMLGRPARRRPDERFVVAGPMYPDDLQWPANVERIEYVPPDDHPAFYCGSAFVLNVTRPELRAFGYSPSVRLFEAAACGATIISDPYPGFEEIFEPGQEIVVAESGADVNAIVEYVDEHERALIGEAARARVLSEHTARRRVEQLRGLVRGELPVPAAG